MCRSNSGSPSPATLVPPGVCTRKAQGSFARETRRASQGLSSESVADEGTGRATSVIEISPVEQTLLSAPAAQQTRVSALQNRSYSRISYTATARHGRSSRKHRNGG